MGFSCNAEASDVDLGLRVGMNMYKNKPMSLATVKEVISKYHSYSQSSSHSSVLPKAELPLVAAKFADPHPELESGVTKVRPGLSNLKRGSRSAPSSPNSTKEGEEREGESDDEREGQNEYKSEEEREDKSEIEIEDQSEDERESARIAEREEKRKVESKERRIDESEKEGSDESKEKVEREGSEVRTMEQTYYSIFSPPMLFVILLSVLVGWAMRALSTY